METKPAANDEGFLTVQTDKLQGFQLELGASFSSVRFVSHDEDDDGARVVRRRDGHWPKHTRLLFFIKKFLRALVIQPLPFITFFF
jgi:hypothetical protein